MDYPLLGSGGLRRSAIAVTRGIRVSTLVEAIRYTRPRTAATPTTFVPSGLFNLNLEIELFDNFSYRTKRSLILPSRAWSDTQVCSRYNFFSLIAMIVSVIILK